MFSRTTIVGLGRVQTVVSTCRAAGFSYSAPSFMKLTNDSLSSISCEAA